MLDNAIISVVVGGLISAVMFVPLLIWQYRRYGAFQPGRTLWTVTTFVYVTALITYTLFPLPEITDDYCATRSPGAVIDPTLYFREMAERLHGLPVLEILTSWDVLQMVFNVALFVPLGVILSDFVVLKARWGILVGFGVSLLIEATQFTGNWGLMPCAYRVADVNDLMTNTLGTAVGYLIALLIPRFVARPAYLRKRRLQARPVTRGRRWTGMLLDLLFWLTSWGVLTSLLSIALIVVSGEPLVVDGVPRPTTRIVWFVGWAVSMLVIVIPACTGNGASLGQRTVYLRPLGTRWRLILRALVVQGLAATAFSLNVPSAELWVLAALVSVFFDIRGLSCLIAGCQLVDSRGLPAVDLFSGP